MERLRSLVAAWTPEENRRTGGCVVTGVTAVDDALGGGLPRGLVTELVEATPSAGGERVLWSLLTETRGQRLRVALIDATDSFAPSSYEAVLLSHLVWVRPRDLREAVSAADILVRDGNYAVVVLDLRGVAARTLRQLSASVWHRLRIEAEQRSSAILVRSGFGFFPAVPWRLVLGTPTSLKSLRRPRSERIHDVVFQVERSRTVEREELVG